MPAGNTSSAGGRLSYEDWQGLLEERFFSGAYVGRRFWLYVDGDILDELAATRGATQGTTQLIELGRNYVGQEGGPGIFTGAVQRGFAAWLAGEQEGPPPVLPVLALSVLAATRMKQSGRISQTNYYRRFRELLGLPPSGGQPRRFEESVVAYWKALKVWADNRRDTIGDLLIPVSPSPAYVGYPISQALWRQADTDRLAEALWHEYDEQLLDADLERVEPLAAQLVEGLVSDRALQVFRDEQFREIRRGVLEDIIAAPPATASAGRQLRAATTPVLLRGHPGPQLRLAFVVERNRRWPDVLKGALDGTDHIIARAPPQLPDYYALEDVQVTDERLRSGFVIETDVGQWRFEPHALYVLSPHPQLGLATTRLGSADTAIVVAPADVERGAGWPRALADPTLPEGWVRFDGVDVTDGLAHDLAIHVVEARQPPLELDGGLTIRPRTYLPFALPRIRLPATLTTQDTVEATIDDATLRLPVRDRHAELHNLDLHEGRHTVQIGEAIASFVISQGLALACPFRADHAVGLSDVRVLGSYIDPLPDPPKPRPVVVSSRADEIVLLGGAVGQIDHPPPGDPPLFLRRTPVQALQHQVRPPFDVVWVIEQRRRGPKVRPVIPRAPTMDDTADPLAARRWAEAVRTYLEGTSPQDEYHTLAVQYTELATQIIDSAQGTAHER